MILHTNVSTMGLGLASPPAESATGFDRVVLDVAGLRPKQSGSLPPFNPLPDWYLLTATRSRVWPDVLYRCRAGIVFVEVKISGVREGESVGGSCEIADDAKDFIGRHDMHAGVRAITTIVRKALPSCRIVVSLCGYGDESGGLLVKFKVLAGMRGADAVRAEKEIAGKALEALDYDVVNRFMIVVR